MTKVLRIPQARQYDEVDPELGVRITKLERCEAGYWTARITVRNQTHNVDRRYGSWRVTPAAEGGSHRQLLPAFASALQTRVRTIERAETRQLTQEAKAA